jgi:hypothetical protein
VERSGLAEQSRHFLTAEEADQRSIESLRRNGEHPLNKLSVFWVAEGSKTKEGVDGGQPGVARPHGVSPLVFQMIEKARDQAGIQVADVKL